MKKKSSDSLTIAAILIALINCHYLVDGLVEEETKPTFLTGTVGGHVIFDCSLDFPHDIEIPFALHWSKDHQEIYSLYDGTTSMAEPYQGRIVQLKSENYGKGSINLTNIRESDVGWYECQVVFPNRSPVSRNNGTWYYLSVDGGNLIAIPPMNRTVMENEEATFPCVVKNSANTNVTWYKDGTLLSELLDLGHRSWSNKEGSLTINPTTMSDLGEYLCEARNTAGEIQTAKAYLNVQFKAKVVYAPREVYFAFGRPAILDCHYRANPPLTNLRWMKDGYLFDPYNVQGVFYRRNGSLYFSKVDDSHNGHYSCTPYNDLGTEGPSPLIEVIVRRPPIFTVKPSNIYLKKLGETLDMHCDAIDSYSVHKPTLTWSRKDALPLPAGRYIMQGGNISIENIQEEDRGMYECTASNEAATISVETELMIDSVAPRAPYNLTAETTRNSVTISWVPGYMRPHLEFSIWYRATDTAEWRTMRILSRKTTEATIPHLLPGKEYEFMVLSQDKHGDGMFSKALRVRTKGMLEPIVGTADDYPSTLGAFQQIGPPVNVSVTVAGDSYLVTWDPPIFGKDILAKYIVKWTKGPRESFYGTAETLETFHFVRDLDENETYQFQVFSLSNNNYQAASGKYILTIPPYRKLKSITTGIIVSIIILGIALALVFYGRKKWCADPSSSVNGKLTNS